jgi:hypothetical protein
MTIYYGGGGKRSILINGLFLHKISISVDTTLLLFIVHVSVFDDRHLEGILIEKRKIAREILFEKCKEVLLRLTVSEIKPLLENIQRSIPCCVFVRIALTERRVGTHRTDRTTCLYAAQTERRVGTQRTDRTAFWHAAH